MRIRFGDFSLDTDSRELLREGQPVQVSGKAFRLLEVLVKSAPKALSKDELQDGVWPDVFVSEANLASLVAELRRALGDDARRPRSIRTVYGFGYAFCGELEATARPAGPGRSGVSRFRLLWGQKEIVLAQGANVFGRGPESLEWINRETVSRRHARIVVTGDAATLEDLGSKNGTFLRGQQVEGVEPLADGDEIRLGSVPFTVKVFADLGSTASRSRARR